MTNKKILVTGADGFIGSHLVEMLVGQGQNVRAMTLYNSLNSRGWLDSLPKQAQSAIEVFPGDIRDPYLVREAVRDCSVVFHLAALIAIPYSYLAPASYIDTNIHGTLNVLQAARDEGVEKVIHTSTSETYGTAQFVPISEEHPLVGQSPYSASKIGADQLALSFYKSFETPICIVRPFNTYGPRQSSRAVIPTIITQIANGQRRINLGSLSPTRDLSYVSDTVKGFIEIAKSKNVLGEVINLGTGYEISINNLAQTIAELMGASIEINCIEERFRPGNSEVERLVSDSSKCRRLTGWEPEFEGAEGLRKGLLKTIKWFLDPMNLVRYSPHDYVL